jgi:hypothetical protein
VKSAVIASTTTVRSLVLLPPLIGLLACFPANAGLGPAKIFQAHCWKYHSEAQVSGLDLHSRESSLRGGEHGKVIVPGDAENGRLYRLISNRESPRMPADGTSTTDQIETIRNSINVAANWDIPARPREAIRRASLLGVHSFAAEYASHTRKEYLRS